MSHHDIPIIPLNGGTHLELGVVPLEPSSDPHCRGTDVSGLPFETSSTWVTVAVVGCPPPAIGGTPRPPPPVVLEAWVVSSSREEHAVFLPT